MFKRQQTYAHVSFGNSLRTETPKLN